MKLYLAVFVLLSTVPLSAQTDFEKKLAERDARITELEARLGKLEEQKGDPLDEAVKEAEQAAKQDSKDEEKFGDDIWFHRAGPVTFRLIDISVDGLFSVGYSSRPNHETNALQGGAHDPKRRGFTLNQVELSFAGAVDPIFRAEAHMVVSEEGLELEEAFFQTTALPAGLQVEGGYFLTEFGRINPTHPHAWDFVDQPVAVTRIMGPEGMRGAGARLGWLLPTPWFFELHFGVQNGNDGSMVSFLGEGHEHGHGHEEDEEEHEESIGGYGAVERDIESFHEFVYLFRMHHHVDAGPFGVSIGISGLYGGNRSGDSGKTWIGGVDLTTKWAPEGTSKGTLFVKTQAEFLYRYYQADAFVHEGDPSDPLDDEAFDSTVLGDWGGYLYVMFGWHHGWQFGLRGEFADAFREGELRRQDDPLRDRRYRGSALVEWEATEFSRFRLQYNFDHMEHLQNSTAHSVWFSVEILFGKHPAHNWAQ
ncbi:MAG: hypothetical protein R3E76_13815 [Planctomycetota bacterium]